MNTEESILKQLIRIGNLLETMQPNPMMKIPDASKALSVGTRLLRQWCKDEIIPCTKLNNRSHPQYLIDVPRTREFLIRSGHLIISQPLKRGRKPKLNLSL